MVSLQINTSRAANQATDDRLHLYNVGERALLCLFHHRRTMERNQMTTTSWCHVLPSLQRLQRQHTRWTQPLCIGLLTWVSSLAPTMAAPVWRRSLLGSRISSRILQLDRKGRAVSSSCLSLRASRSAALGRRAGRDVGSAHPSAPSAFRYGQPGRSGLNCAIGKGSLARSYSNATTRSFISCHWPIQGHHTTYLMSLGTMPS